jgi:hypothetical protein
MKDLSKIDPIELLQMYIEARADKKGICDIVPIHAINAALGSIEEILYFLDIEPYFKRNDDYDDDDDGNHYESKE